MGSSCEKRIVGMRPGEKLHEEMITASDSPTTLDLGEYFAILPTDRVEGYKKRYKEAGIEYSTSTDRAIGVDMVKKLRKRIPLRRLGKVEDICLGLGFIIDNKYYTGCILEIDGGLTI